MNYTNDLMMSSFCKTINSNVSLTSLISTLNDEFSMTVYCAVRNINLNGFFKVIKIFFCGPQALNGINQHFISIESC